MRILLLTATLLSVSLAMPGAERIVAENNPYVRLTQTIKDGTLRVTAKNISHKPILAYVVAVENGGQATTHHDFFTGRDAFAPGKTVEIVFAVSPSTTPNVFVDYVRLSDRSSWGNAITDDGKDVAASFQK
jgi:hypothetical protein